MRESTAMRVRPQRFQQGSGCLERHRHTGGYLALVLSGGYLEAGYGKRMKVGPGEAIVHQPFDCHANWFTSVRATILNLPLSGCWQLPDLLKVEDVDAIAREAGKSAQAALHLFLQTATPWVSEVDDWPDELAEALYADPSLKLATWRAKRGIGAEQLSREFGRCYGVSPSQYRIEARGRRALKSVMTSSETLTSVALDAGYSDQAHMTRDLRRLTGFTPGVLRWGSNAGTKWVSRKRSSQ